MADLEHRDKLESSLSGKLASLSAEQRKAIEPLLGTPPNVAHVPRQFWDKLESDARNALAVVLIATFLKSLHGEQQYLDEDAEDAAYAWAEARSEAIAAGYMQNTKDRVYKVTKGAFATPSDEFDGEELVDDLDSIFGRSRADTIAATEVTTASTAAVRHISRHMPGATLVWRLGDAEHCQRCIALDGTEEHEWGRVEGAEHGPPLHPRCRCWCDIRPE
jgi:hypothetical protein